MANVSLGTVTNMTLWGLPRKDPVQVLCLPFVCRKILVKE